MKPNEDISNDKRLQKILNIIYEVASGNYDIYEEIDDKGDELDAVIIGLNMLVYELSENQGIKKLNEQLTDAINDLKSTQAQLVQSQKMEALGTLAGGIAHDFNNILVSILGNAELGLMELSQDRQERAYFENILESGERAANLVRQIVTFSRMEAIRLKSVNLASIIPEALKIARATIPTNIEIRQDVLEVCPNIMADATQIYQIMLNLCTNAYHAMEDTGGVLEVTLKEWIGPPPALEMKAENYLELSVKDNGCGISKEDQERIFDPFFTTKEVGKGTGLGLAVVFGIVEKHQGKITVDSKIDKGTTISIFFPTTANEVSKETNKESVIARKGEADSPVRLILIVEDEPMVSRVYKRFLEKMGYVVTVCSDGYDALALFKKNPNQFDLVLTDQAMPNMTGKQLTKELLAIRPDLPVLLSTGYSDVITEEEAQELGIRKYLMKPVKLENLKQEIDECLRSSG